MATITRKNKAVVETNHLACVRNGNIVAQYPAAADLENGMAVVVDFAAKSVGLPTAGAETVYLHFSEELVYESHLGRNSFYVPSGEYPKCGKLEVGDIFETNAVSGDVTKGKFVTPATTGLWAAAATAPASGAYGLVQDLVTLPNGEAGVKIVIMANAS